MKTKIEITESDLTTVETLYAMCIDNKLYKGNTTTLVKAKDLSAKMYKALYPEPTMTAYLIKDDKYADSKYIGQIAISKPDIIRIISDQQSLIKDSVEVCFDDMEIRWKYSYYNHAFKRYDVDSDYTTFVKIKI